MFFRYSYEHGKKYGKLFSLSINENEYYEFTSSEDANR